MAREPIPSWYFALVVVRLGHRFLLVHERKHGQTWYFPAGRVEPGETLAAGAVRETLEEAGIPVILEGIHQIQHTPYADGTSRVRVIFVARPAGDTPPKGADEETLGARWFTLQELATVPLRGDEVQRVLERVAAGAPLYSLSLLTSESL